MRIFFRLSDPQLRFAGCANNFSQNMRELCWRKNKRRRISNVILRQANEVHLWPRFAVKAVKLLQQECLRELPCAVGAKIEKQNCIAIANALLVRIAKNQRRHKLVRLARFVLSIQRFRRRGSANFTATQNDCIPRFLCSIPTTIAIHCKVAANNRNDLRPARL